MGWYSIRKKRGDVVEKDVELMQVEMGVQPTDAVGWEWGLWLRVEDVAMARLTFVESALQQVVEGACA